MKRPKYDYESEDKDILKALNNIEKIMLKKYPPCKTIANNCYTCRIWCAFDNLKIQFY